MIQHKTMPISEIIDRVTAIARKYNVKRLDLFGSFARGTQTETSDIDFIIYGCEDINAFEEEVENIPTLRKIDIFNYDEVCSEYLREDMDKYGKQIF
jgi:predicted nucleotidyltransferase